MKSILAIILAVICVAATAAPTHSMVGARHISNVGGTLSAKSYVQDGLVAMWDGIENAGWGTHDANATTWVDLTGNGHDAALSGKYSWSNMSWDVESVKTDRRAKG